MTTASLGILALFTVELLLLLAADPVGFFTNPFHILDLLVVVGSAYFEAHHLWGPHVGGGRSEVELEGGLLVAAGGWGSCAPARVRGLSTRRLGDRLAGRLRHELRGWEANIFAAEELLTNRLSSAVAHHHDEKVETLTKGSHYQEPNNNGGVVPNPTIPVACAVLSEVEVEYLPPAPAAAAPPPFAPPAATAPATTLTKPPPQGSRL
ncbi:unnamed protein product, partial [Heterosigma akashiwo]